MKRFGRTLCVGALVLGLAACGKNAQEDSSGETQQEESGSQEPGETQEESASGEMGEQEGDADIPENDVPEGFSQEMESLRQAVISAVGEENYWPDMPMDPEMFEFFFNIPQEMYEDYMAESPMISANVDTLVIVRAKEDQADAVEEILNAYREEKVNDTMQYPMNIGKIQASQVERMGNYVIFVQLGGAMNDDQTQEEAVLHCQEANGLALDAIREIIQGN